MKSFLGCLFLATTVIFVTGCSTLAAIPNREAKTTQFVPTNFRGDGRLPADVQRVAVLPTHGGEVVPQEIARAMEVVLLKALQRQMRFEVVMVSREEMRSMYGLEDFNSTAALPNGFMERIAEKYAVDAVLFTDLTVYRAYRPIALGFRSKLATIRDVRLVWAFDEVFSAEDPAMVNTVRIHSRQADRAAPVDPTPAVLQSPLRFGAVAADVMYRTLPPR